MLVKAAPYRATAGTRGSSSSSPSRLEGKKQHRFGKLQFAGGVPLHAHGSITTMGGISLGARGGGVILLTSMSRPVYTYQYIIEYVKIHLYFTCIKQLHGAMDPRKDLTVRGIMELGTTLYA